MSFGFQIAVDARQVKEARQSVVDLGTTLVDLNNSDVSIGGEKFSRDAELLKQAAQDITRMGNLSRSGEAKGGVLNTQQWKDAALLSKRVGENLGDWVKQSQKLREELKQVNEDLKGLHKASMDPSLSAKHRQMMLDEMGMLKDQREGLEKELNGRGKGDARADFLRGRGAEYSGNIAGYGTKNEDAARAQASALGKIERVMGTVVALAGGASLLSMVHRSLETYKQRETTGADLGAMGVGDSGASDFLYGERTSAKMELARRTGYNSTQMLRASADFARGRNVPLDSMVGFMGSTYKSTGMGESGITGLTAGIFATTANTKRQVDVLEGIQKLLANQAQQQGGPVSKEQAALLAGMFTHNFDKSVSMQGTGIYDKLNSGIAGGGKNPGEQLLLWTMAGGDKNDGSFERLNEIQGNMSEGIANPTIRKNLRTWMDKNLGGKAQRISFLHSMFGLNTRKGGEAELAYDELINADVPGESETIANAGEDSWKSSYSGSTTRKLALESENTRARSGQGLGPGLQKLEAGMLKIGNDFLDKVAKIQNAGDAVREGGKFIKDTVKTMWDDAGPLGKLLTMTGGVYLAIKALGTALTLKTAYSTALEGVAGGVLTGAGAKKFGGRLLAGGPIAAGVMAGVDTMYGDLANIDEAKLAKAPSGNTPASAGGEAGISDAILSDIYRLLQGTVGRPKPPVYGGNAPTGSGF